MEASIKVYSLSTCGHCLKTKEYLEEHNIPFDCVNVDWLMGPERNDVMYALGKLNAGLTFPTIVIGEKVIIGFRPEEIEAALKDQE